MELHIHIQTSTMKPLKFGNGQKFTSHKSLDMWLLIHDGIKVKPCQQKGPYTSPTGTTSARLRRQAITWIRWLSSRTDTKMNSMLIPAVTLYFRWRSVLFSGEYVNVQLVHTFITEVTLFAQLLYILVMILGLTCAIRWFKYTKTILDLR